MENKAMPMIFFNLCGEMLYVLLQRLDAQNILPEKKAKVILDILKTMLNTQFLQELFKPQKMYSRLAMQFVFEKLVHSSIMRLNKNSMKKLYDLMLMVFKYQVVNCDHPEDVYFVTLNHLNSIKNTAEPYPEILEDVNNLYSVMILNYKDLCHKDYECLYECINAFLEDLNIRVSVLLKLGLQLPSGEIVVSKHCVHHQTSEFAESWKDDSHNLQISEENCFTLGTNIYTQSSLLESNSATNLQTFSSENVIENEIKDCKNEELNLLTRLIGKCALSNSIPEIMLATSPDEEKKYRSESGVYPENHSFITIDASQVSMKSLEKIGQELLIKEENDKFDILDLMDSEEVTATKAK